MSRQRLAGATVVVDRFFGTSLRLLLPAVLDLPAVPMTNESRTNPASTGHGFPCFAYVFDIAEHGAFSPPVQGDL